VLTNPAANSRRPPQLPFTLYIATSSGVGLAATVLYQVVA
jgi:hypothetical protein